MKVNLGEDFDDVKRVATCAVPLAARNVVEQARVFRDNAEPVRRFVNLNPFNCLNPARRQANFVTRAQAVEVNLGEGFDDKLFAAGHRAEVGQDFLRYFTVAEEDVITDFGVEHCCL